MSNKYIPAATILLLRDEPSFEVLMIERHADTPFAGGAVVFPGGRIDPGDHIEAWTEYSTGLDAVPPEQKAPRVAAIREAFEETGMLLARRDGTLIDHEISAELASWRDIVEQDDSQFFEMVKRYELSLAIDALHLYSRWRPPENAPHRRYDTWFFAAKAPEHQTAQADGGEALEILWTSPKAAISARDEGKVKMIYPTSRNVELLGVSETVLSVFQNAAARKIEAITPFVKERDGKSYLAIPENLGYPVTEEPLETAFRS
ncbi:NUDIX hydrolase [Hyphococcus sp. DH-69]|uniref:NUDIX hydrolase n=1 Tax=Hyphococcus formosus TaxID=3143534 RepID=UPI00398AFC19